MLKGWKRPRLASRHFAIARELLHAHAQRSERAKKKKHSETYASPAFPHSKKKKQMRDQSGNVDTPDYFEEDQADVGGAGVCLRKYYAHVQFSF